MAQHFLLSAKAKTLSLLEVARMTDDEAHASFRAVRFAENGGEPFCPKCGCDAIYEYESRRIFKCKQCAHQFSITSGTIFANRKMSLGHILMAIAIFVNGANGHSALQLSRDLKCNYRTAFVLAHKLREIFGTQQATHKLTGIVEIDGLWTGGHIKKTNLVKNRVDRRISNPRRQSVVTMRERRPGGRTLSFVFRTESESIATILAHVHESAKIRTDEAAHWNILKGHFADVKSVNHSKDGYVVNGVHTNWVESFNSRMELRKNYNDDDYKQFRADLSLYITQIMLHAADADRSGTVPLLDENRQALRTKIYHLRKAIDNTDLPDWRKKRLHKRLDELEQELTRVRIRMSVVVAVALAIYGVPGEAVASYDAVIRVANGIMHLIDEAKEADHEQRKISHQEAVALLPPRQKQQPLIAESFDRSEMDDEIPF